MQEKCQSDKIALVVVFSLFRTAGVMENIQHYPNFVEGKYFIDTAAFQRQILLTDKYYIS